VYATPKPARNAIEKAAHPSIYEQPKDPSWAFSILTAAVKTTKPDSKSNAENK